MPPNSKFRFFSEGKFFKCKDQAKQDAAYLAILQLYKEKSFTK